MGIFIIGVSRLSAVVIERRKEGRKKERERGKGRERKRERKEERERKKKIRKKKKFLTQELNQGLPHCRRIVYQLSSQGSPKRRKTTLKHMHVHIGLHVLVHPCPCPHWHPHHSLHVHTPVRVLDGFTLRQ